jgi:hypothetical protein
MKRTHWKRAISLTLSKENIAFIKEQARKHDPRWSVSTWVGVLIENHKLGLEQDARKQERA